MNIEDAIHFYGSAAKLAKQLGVDRSAITHWRKKGSIPELRQYQIEAITKGALRANLNKSTP